MIIFSFLYKSDALFFYVFSKYIDFFFFLTFIIFLEYAQILMKVKISKRTVFFLNMQLFVSFFLKKMFKVIFQNVYFMSLLWFSFSGSFIIYTFKFPYLFSIPSFFFLNYFVSLQKCMFVLIFFKLLFVLMHCFIVAFFCFNDLLKLS